MTDHARSFPRTTPFLAVVALLSAALVACTDEDPSPRARPSPRVPQLLVDRGEDELHVQARWEQVAAFEGAGETVTRSFSIAEDAIQWQVRWSCKGTGDLTIRPTRLAEDERTLVEASCPASGEGVAIDTGTQSLHIEAQGPWSARVEQQVDTPLYEEPLPAMRAARARILGRGRLYDVELEGTGSASLYALPGGQLAIRLENFWLTPNIDLELWTSTLEHPRTSKQLVNRPHRKIAFLRATAGSQNYLLPRDVDADDVSSIAIWCELTHQIYAAAEV